MEKTQGLKNSVSLTTNTHSSIWPVGPLALFPHIYGYKHMNKQTPCTRKQHKHLLRSWHRFSRLALKSKWCHRCCCKMFAHSGRNIHPHVSTTSHFQTRMMEDVYQFQCCEKNKSLSLWHSCLPHKLCSSSREWEKQETYSHSLLLYVLFSQWQRIRDKEALLSK